MITQIPDQSAGSAMRFFVPSLLREVRIFRSTDIFLCAAREKRQLMVTSLLFHRLPVTLSNSSRPANQSKSEASNDFL